MNTNLPFDRYFQTQEEYPEDILHGLELGTYWDYVASSYLDGLVNYLTWVEAAVLERYRPLELARLDQMLAGPHTQFHLVGNDVLLLGRPQVNATVQDDSGEKQEWWVFWYDPDVSDCSIGRFATGDPAEMVRAHFREWVQALAQHNRRGLPEEGYWNLPTACVFFHAEKMKGWLAY